MPIHEYVCEKCGNEFEELVFGGEKIACAKCKSAKVTKKFSTFASTSGASSGASAAQEPGSCGTCGDPRGPGACSMN